MLIAEKRQLPPFRLGMCTAEEPLVEFRRRAAEGRASWLLGGSASAKAGPKSSESEAAVCRISSSPKETKSRAFGLGNRKSCKNSTGEFARACSGEGGREKARPVFSLSISSSSTSEPQVATSQEAAASRSHEEPRRCSMRAGEKFPFTILKPRAEGYETEIVANLAL